MSISKIVLFCDVGPFTNIRLTFLIAEKTWKWYKGESSRSLSFEDVFISNGTNIAESTFAWIMFKDVCET